VTAQALVIGRELERLDGLWEDGLSDTYRSYLDSVDAYDKAAQPKLALAAALIEAGLRLQGLGGSEAPAAALLMGDLCLARASRLIADTASQDLQIAFARAIEELGYASRPARQAIADAVASAFIGLFILPRAFTLLRQAAEVAQAEPAAVRGGTLTASDFEYPVTLNPLTGLTDLELRLGELVFAPLWGFDDQLRPYADLAREVPTQGNGAVHTSPDSRSMTVDVKLSPGLRWSDGQSLTADDVIFTLQALRDPTTQALSPAGLDRLKDVRRVSGSELLLTFDGIYAPYLQLGAGLFVMPKHRLGTVSLSEWSRDAFFQRPDVASGPFVVQDAVLGDRIVFGANPRSRSSPRKRLSSKAVSSQSLVALLAAR